LLTPGEERLLEFLSKGLDDGVRLFQFINYAIGVYRIGRMFARVGDGRRDPEFTTATVVRCLFMAAVLRVPSFNQLEQLLADGRFQKLLGFPGKKRRGDKVFSADVIVDVVDTIEVAVLQAAMVELVKRAATKKVFRHDTYGSYITIAIDGWEPFCTYKRHCSGCLTRKVTIKKKDEDGNEIKEKVTQYYHRCVVAFLVAPKIDLTLAIEPVLSSDLREDLTPKEARHEGELTAALRLIDRLRKDYGCFIDSFALDGLYACGPVFEKLTEHKYGAFVICKKKKDDPYRFAESIWEHREQPDEVMKDPETGEKVEFWFLKDVDALKSFDGSVDMVKARVTRKSGKTSTWVMALVGKAKKVRPLAALRAMRARWHIENTAFHQWVKRWGLDHCYRHTPNAILAMLYIFAIAFNLMQLFYYRRLGKPRRGRKPEDTLIGCVKEMWIDLGELPGPVPWHLLHDDTT
jgi:hypothetical protein